MEIVHLLISLLSILTCIVLCLTLIRLNKIEAKLKTLEKWIAGSDLKDLEG